MKTKILNVLRKSDGYVSGQALCNMLGVSRTAVWKVINQLKEEGYVIEAVQNKGYHITQYPDILTSSEIMSQLKCVDTGSTTGIIREVVYYDETDSTNNEAKRAAERDNAADGTLYITESQTGGRGRRGRNWVSPAGSGIWMSLLLRPDISPVNASMLTIVAAMAVQEAIHKVLTEDGHVAECRIKWPNDIVLNKKKVYLHLFHLFRSLKTTEKVLKIKGFVRNRYRKNIYSIPVPHAVPTPTEEAPVQAFRMFHFSNCSPLNANASKKQPFLG